MNESITASEITYATTTPRDETIATIFVTVSSATLKATSNEDIKEAKESQNFLDDNLRFQSNHITPFVIIDVITAVIKAVIKLEITVCQFLTGALFNPEISFS